MARWHYQNLRRMINNPIYHAHRENMISSMGSTKEMLIVLHVLIFFLIQVRLLASCLMDDFFKNRRLRGNSKKKTQVSDLLHIIYFILPIMVTIECFVASNDTFNAFFWLFMHEIVYSGSFYQSNQGMWHKSYLLKQQIA